MKTKIFKSPIKHFPLPTKDAMSFVFELKEMINSYKDCYTFLYFEPYEHAGSKGILLMGERLVEDK